MTLPENIDATYEDRNAGDAAHQQHHDALHVLYNAIEVSGGVDAFLLKAGGTMTGDLTLAGAPTDDLHAATKKYVDDNAGGGGTSGVLAVVQYTSGSGHYSTSSTALVAVDTTNLRATFTAPDSGSVLVHLEAVIDTSSPSVTGYAYLGVVESGVSRGARGLRYFAGSGAHVNAQRGQTAIEVTGLTPGDEYSFDMAWRVANATQTIRLFKGGAEEAPSIWVEALP